MTHNFKEAGFLGRWGLAPRRGVILIPKNVSNKISPRQGAKNRIAAQPYFLKIFDFVATPDVRKEGDRESVEKEVAAFQREAQAYSRATENVALFPARFVASWTESPNGGQAAGMPEHGFILSRYIPTALWTSLNATAASKALDRVFAQLKHIHEKNMEWEDVAPKNIAVTTDGEASIIDFEDAKPLTAKGELLDWKKVWHMFEFDASESWAQLDALLKQKFPPEYKRVAAMSWEELGGII